MHLYHMTTSANVLEAKNFCFVSKQACIIAYEVRIMYHCIRCEDKL